MDNIKLWGLARDPLSSPRQMTDKTGGGWGGGAGCAADP